MEKFQLFMGELGNGLTVCNSAVMEHGDYKQIAHISPAGNIKWYVPAGAVPGDALLRIEHTADAMHSNFKNALERGISIDPIRTCARMLGALPESAFLAFIQNRYDDKEQEIEALEALYLQFA